MNFMCRRVASQRNVSLSRCYSSFNHLFISRKASLFVAAQRRAPIQTRFLSNNNLMDGPGGSIIINLNESNKVSFKDLKSADSKPMKSIMRELKKFGKYASAEDVERSFTSARKLRSDFIKNAKIEKLRPSMTDNLNSLLYVFESYNNSQDFLETFSLMESNQIINEATYSIIVRHKVRTENWRSGLKIINKMKSQGIQPHSRTYHCLICNAVEIGDLEDALSLFKEMQALEIIFSDEFYSSLIDISSAHQKTSNDFMLNVFNLLKGTGFTFNTKTLNKAMAWFSRKTSYTNDQEWNAKLSCVDIRGSCSGCGSQIKEFRLPDTTRTNLQNSLFDVAKKAVSTDKGMPGNASLEQLLSVSNIGSPISKIDALRHLVDVSGPFDVVLDVLNIAYARNKGFNAFQVKRVAKHFIEQGKRVLVLCSSPLESSLLRSNSSDTSIQHMVKLLHYLKKNECGLFFVDDRKEDGHIDDYFLLLSIVFHNMNIGIVTGDNFFDHVHSLDAVTKRHFQRWKRAHQIVLKSFTAKGQPVFAARETFDIDVQSKDDSWHIPGKAGQWLCCTKR